MTQATYNPYAILGLADNAPAGDIKKAYKRLVKLHHPDVGGNAEDFDKVQKAYDLLQDEERLAQGRLTGQEPAGNSQEDAQRQALIAMVMLHLDTALEEDEYTGLKAEMLKTMKAHLEELGKAQAKVQKKAQVLQKRLGRLSGESLIVSILRDKVAKAQEEIAFRQREGKLLAEAQKLVDQLQEAEPEPRPPTKDSADLRNDLQGMIDALMKEARGPTW